MNPWEQEFRQRMSRFGADKGSDGMLLSVKVRVSSGCFCRSCCPAAHERLDRYRKGHPLDERYCDYVEHESGPEILMTVLAGALNATAAVVNLVAAVIKARSEGRKDGDRRREPLTVIIRGVGPDDSYFEREVLTADTGNPPKLAKIKETLSEAIELIAADRVHNENPPKKARAAKRKGRKRK